MAGIQALGLTPCRRSAALIQIPDNFNIAEWPVFSSVLVDWYAKPVSGKMMVSPAEEIVVQPHDAFVDDLVLAKGIDRYQKMVNVDVTRVEHSWAGLRTFTPDRIPVVGYDPRIDGFFWLAGQGGYGIETSPALSTLAAQLLTREAISAQAQDICIALDPGRLIM
ncbi:MAG: D-arginine dehydrogenase [Parasphingorhabdus sp.]|jgi:D-arginine dehydrogenase